MPGPERVTGGAQNEGARMLREEVTEVDIADIVAKWTGIPVRDRIPHTLDLDVPSADIVFRGQLGPRPAPTLQVRVRPRITLHVPQQWRAGHGRNPASRCRGVDTPYAPIPLRPRAAYPGDSV